MIGTTTLSLGAVWPAAADCGECGGRLRDALVARAAIAGAHLSADQARLVVHYDPAQASAATVLDLASQLARDLDVRYVHRTLPVVGMDCADCARTLGNGLCALPGVGHAAADFASGTLAIEYDSSLVGLQAIARRATSLGYHVTIEGERTTRLRVVGMDCADCAVQLERGLAARRGVLEVAIDFAAGTATIRHDPAVAPVAALVGAVGAAGYAAHLPADAAATTDHWRRWTFERLRGIGLATVALAVGLLSDWLGGPWPVAATAYATAVAVGGWRIGIAAVQSLRTTRSADMNVLMSIGILGAGLTHHWSEAATIVVLFGVGTLLESLAVERGRRSLDRLLQLVPSTALLVTDAGPRVTAIGDIGIGSLVSVLPGSRVPLDGLIVEGRAELDQASVTGEFVPVDRGPGDAVYAGSVNGTAPLVVRTTALAKDSTVERIGRLVHEARARRAPIEASIDAFARWYTPAVIVAAVAMATLPPLFLGGDLARWVYRALVLLVTACPCALVVSTPVAMVAALSAAARDGLLVRGARYLEVLGRARVIAFDKTGTLTRGQPTVVSVEPRGVERAVLLALAAAVESLSEHRLAEAVVAAARREGLALPNATCGEVLPGRGLRALVAARPATVGAPHLFQTHTDWPQLAQQVTSVERRGETAVVVEYDGRLLGVLGVADELRDGAAEAVRQLRTLGLRSVVMLTGDNASVAGVMAAKAGVTDVRAGLLPDDKIAAIRELQRSGPVVMVGDGINDAPALSQADVGVAMGGGTALAIETADVTLMTDDLARLPRAVDLGRRTLGLVRQNVAFALAVKVVVLGLAVFGLAELWLAVLADVGGSLLVTLNALRLLQRQAGGHHGER